MNECRASRQVDAHHRYTAAAGHALYTSRRFPKGYWNNIAFICAPTGKLVGQWTRQAKGAGFELQQQPNNIYNSADAWSGPVCAEVGPDDVGRCVLCLEVETNDLI